MCIRCMIKAMGDGDDEEGNDTSGEKTDAIRDMLSTGVDIKEALDGIVSSLDPPMRLWVVCDLIHSLCVAATAGDVPEEARGDAESWEDCNPYDYFQKIADKAHLFLPDAEQMAELWNRHSVEAAEQMVHSKDQLLIPDDWLPEDDSKPPDS